MISHLSPTYLPAVPHYNADSARVILGLSFAGVTTLRILCPNFRLVSQYILDDLSALARMISHLSPR